MSSFHTFYLLPTVQEGGGGTGATAEEILNLFQASPEFGLIRTNLDAKVSGSGGGTGGTVELGELPAKVEEIRTKVNSIGTSKITVISPVLSNGNARIVQGGDYAISEGRSLDFDLTGAFVLSIRDNIASIGFTVEGAFSLLNVSHETIEQGIRVRVELTREQTLLLQPGQVGLQINAIMGNGHHIPLLQGTLTVDRAIV